MGYQDEWLLLEAEDEIDEMEHRPPTEEFLFYQAVTNGDMDAVRKNCEQARFLDSEGVGVLSRNSVTNLKYHFVITTAMITRLCRQKIELAKNLLQYSDYSMIDIANRLSFSSQSHFIQQFRELVGMTPKKYRDMHHAIQWDMET